MALQDARVPRPRENSRQVRERFAEGFASILVLDPPADLWLTRFAQGEKTLARKHFFQRPGARRS